MSQHIERRGERQRQARRRGWTWVVSVGVLAVALVGGAFWLWPASPRPAADGIPRLVVDRTVIDFGDVHFNKLVTATFTLTNAGNGTLQIADVPRVRAVEGC